MWPWGHVAVGYLLYTAYSRARFDEHPSHVPALILVLGTQFPDLVDKPLAWYLGVLPTGRTLAHSLVTALPLVLVVYLAARWYGRGEYGVAFAVGALSHLSVDALPVLWSTEVTANFLLWPVVPVDTYEEGAPTVLGLLLGSLSDPYFFSEFVLVVIALALWVRHGHPGLPPIRSAVRTLQ